MSPAAFADLKPCLLVYDFPKGCHRTHPSVVMRSRGFRVNASAWVVREKDIPHYYLNEIRTARRPANVKIAPFDPSTAGTMIAWAIEELKKEIRSAIDRAKASERAMSDRRTDRDASDQEYAATCRATVRRLRKQLGDYRQAAERFGIDLAAIHATAALQACQAIDAGMRAKSAAYAAMAQVARSIKTREADTIAREIEADRMPAGIAADFIEEKGGKAGERAAVAVRGRFEF